MLSSSTRLKWMNRSSISRVNVQMDPLSIVASAIAVCQAGDRLGGLLSSIEIFMNAPKDLAELLNETSNIRAALLSLQSRIVTTPLEDSASLRKSVEVCIAHVAKIQSFVAECVSPHAGNEENIGKGTNRVLWMRKRRNIARIKRQLKESLSLLQIELLSINFISQIQLSSAISSMGSLFHTVHHDTKIASQRPLIKSSSDISTHDNGNSICKYQTSDEVQIHVERPNPNISCIVSRANFSHFEAFIPAHHQHSCFQHSIQSCRMLWGFVGWLSLEQASYQGGCPGCRSKFSRLPQSYLALSYYTPWWACPFSCTVAFQATPRVCVSISFQTFLPPDAEIFSCIRSGQVERLKTLFIEKRASVADIMGPYGVSTISLAVFYEQVEIYEFLCSLGASRISPMLRASKGSDIVKFWASYSTLDYPVSASTVIQDHIHQTSPQHQAKILSTLGVHPFTEADGFTRLHKCTLRITSESLEALSASSFVDINEKDFLGRTALHLAVYRCDAHALRILLKYNASPDIRDSTGKTPLHIAATMGWAEGTRLLIVSGVDLEQRDQFDNTILHSVCLHGQSHIVQILLDGGVNMEAKNALGETPLRHAVLGNKLGVLRLLHERGAAFTLRCRVGSTALLDAILVNSHEALEFLLELRMRVDQIYLSTGQNALHMLAEHADLRTMQIFLEGADTGLTGLDITSRDEKDLTPLQYLNQQQDDNEFKHLFRLLLKRVQEARKEFDLLYVEGSKTPPNHVDESDKDDENDEFTDAVENQPEIWFSKQT